MEQNQALAARPSSSLLTWGRLPASPHHVRSKDHKDRSAGLPSAQVSAGRRRVGGHNQLSFPVLNQALQLWTICNFEQFVN